jgi:catechol 2,3-dioxygenase-like lactoylglutathione lyase family enzyme
MIDHIGMSVSDITRSTEFYLKALAPLGISIVMEVSAEQTGHGAAVGFGANFKPFFWIGEAEGLGVGHVHVAFAAPSRAAVDDSIGQRLPPAARTTASRACARIITRTTMVPSCSISTATISRRYATPPRKGLCRKI